MVKDSKDSTYMFADEDKDVLPAYDKKTHS